MSTTHTAPIRTTALRAYPGWTVREYRMSAGHTTFNVANADGSSFLCGAATFGEAVQFAREQTRGKRAPRRGDDNPWKAQHIEREYAYTGDGYTRAMVRRACEWEYASAPDPVACTCGKRAFYRATIGAMKCPDCGALFTCNGAPID